MNENEDFPDDSCQEIEVIYSDEELENDFFTDEANPTFQDDEIETEAIDLSRLTFKGHKQSVFSCEISNDKSLAVTGGQDDMAYIWSITNGEVVMECTGHKDSIIEASFSRDGTYVATGDMGGMVQVWNVKEKKLVWCYEGDDMQWLLWHRQDNVLFTSHCGMVYVWQIPQGNCKILTGHNSTANCGKVLPNGKQMLVGYEDGQIKLWDIKTSSVVWQLHEPLSTGIIQMDINSDGTLFVVAPSSQVFKVADGKHISNVLVDGEENIEVALFHSPTNVVITGALSGQLCIWDASRYALRHQMKIDCSVTILRCSPQGHLYVGSAAGYICVYDLRTGALVKTLTGHNSAILGLCLSADCQFVLSSSDDGTAKVFDVTC